MTTNRPMILLLLPLALVVTACGGIVTAESDGRDASRTIVATDIDFDRERIEVNAGEAVTLSFVNSGALDHDFSIGEIPLDGTAVSSSPVAHIDPSSAMPCGTPGASASGTCPYVAGTPQPGNMMNMMDSMMKGVSAEEMQTMHQQMHGSDVRPGSCPIANESMPETCPLAATNPQTSDAETMGATDVDHNAHHSDDGDDQHIMSADGSVEPELHVYAAPGDTATVTFTPTVPGEYQFLCTVPGHAQAGMVGTLVVN